MSSAEVKAAIAHISEEVDIAVVSAAMFAGKYPDRDRAILRLGYSIMVTMQPHEMARHLAEALMWLYEDNQDTEALMRLHEHDQDKT